MTKLVIMIPALNEEKNIADVIKRIPKKMASKTEIVVINDGSTDRTKEVAKAAGATVIGFKKNRGLAIAFKKGVEYAISVNADIIVNIDADGQHPPEKIPELISPIIKDKADLVIGSRLIQVDGKMKKSKFYSNILLSKFMSFLIGQNIYDSTSGFRAFTSEVAKAMNIIDKYTYTQQQLIQAAYHKFKILEIPIPIINREDGESRLMKNIFSYAFSVIGILLYSFTYCYPLASFGLVGFLSILLGLGLDMLFPTRYIMSAVFILAGTQLVLFGLLFNLLKKYTIR